MGIPRLVARHELGPPPPTASTPPTHPPGGSYAIRAWAMKEYGVTGGEH